MSTRYYRERASGVARLALGLARTRWRPVESKKIFIIGTGRSGTHWVGHILNAHTDIHVDIEKPPIFPWVTEVAVNQAAKQQLLPRILNQYRAEHGLAAPRHYADKSHPTIWIADELSEAFPEAVFVGIKRSVYGTVASMLKHDGVMRWIHDWRRYPVPNRFLGIGEGEADGYEAHSLAARCAMRWRSHVERLDEIKGRLGDRCMILEYEALQGQPDRELAALGEFLRLKSPIPRPEIRHGSLNRWKDELSPKQIVDIDAVVQ